MSRFFRNSDVDNSPFKKRWNFRPFALISDTLNIGVKLTFTSILLSLMLKTGKFIGTEIDNASQQNLSTVMSSRNRNANSQASNTGLNKNNSSNPDDYDSNVYYDSDGNAYTTNSVGVNFDNNIDSATKFVRLGNAIVGFYKNIRTAHDDLTTNKPSHSRNVKQEVAPVMDDNYKQAIVSKSDGQLVDADFFKSNGSLDLDKILKEY